METASIKVKQIPHPDHPGLSFKYVESKEYMTPKVGEDGKTLTGIDENAYEILSLPLEQRAAEQKKIQKERLNLEQILGVSLVPESPYWDKFSIVIEDEQTFDPLNAKHRLYIHFLLANGYVAPDLESITENEKYHNCIFYLYRKDDETSKLVKKKRLLNKVASTLTELESNPNKLKSVAAFIFGYDTKQDINEEEAYIKLNDYIEESPEKEKDRRIKYFLEVASKSQESLMAKIILDKAVKKHFVKTKGGVYTRGECFYGSNYEEAIEFLQDPANSTELITLQKLIGR